LYYKTFHFGSVYMT